MTKDIDTYILGMIADSKMSFIAGHQMHAHLQDL